MEKNVEVIEDGSCYFRRYIVLKFYFVDLVGLERVIKIGNIGERFKEFI